ncbi:MAG: hypothetical protein ACFE9I_15095 [Candidatus Hermodarchaeota archaeon]
MSNLPFLIFNYLEFNIILLIIDTIIVKYLAERKGWDNSYKNAYIFVSIWSLIYYSLLLLIIELPTYILNDILLVDFENYILIANVIIIIIDCILATFILKIVYKKELGESFIFSLIILIFKNILIICLGIVFFPITSFIQLYP